MLLSTIVAALNIPMPSDCSDGEIGTLLSPENAGENDIVFLSDLKYRSIVETCKARYVIVKTGIVIEKKINLTVPDPYVGYARVAQLYQDCSPVFGSGISPAAIIDPSAIIDGSVAVGPGTIIGSKVKIAAGTRIGAHCVIEKDSSIGKDCRIDSGVIIRYDSMIGNRVIIQSGAVIGSDGFGNARENNIFIRIPAFGKVIIEDDVDIGANTTIDRGNFDPTIICKGAKLDNLVHVAHNVTIGEHTAIAAQTGISGSTTVGKRVIIGGQAGFVGHIHIGDDSFIGAKSGISKSTEPGSKITGYPARDLMTMRKIEAAQQSLPDLLKEVKRLRKQMDSLAKSIS